MVLRHQFGEFSRRLRKERDGQRSEHLYLYEVFFLGIVCAAIGLLAINRLIIKMLGQ